MIITCEQCNARYLLASLLLGVAGRKVRCGVCGHEWFQEPVDEPYTRESADAASLNDIEGHRVAEPIPDSVRPIPEGSNVPVLPGQHEEKPKKRVVGGVVAALLVLGILTGGIFALRHPAVQAWPPLSFAFDLAGVSVAMPGEGLIFDGVAARAAQGEDGTHTLTLTGNIINLKARDSALPVLRARLLGEDGHEGAEWVVPLDKHTIGSEETMSFASTYANLPDDVREVNIRFTLD